MACANREI